MLRRILEGMLLSGTALGALVSLSPSAVGSDPARSERNTVERVWASASEVQVYGTAPANRLPGQGPPPVQLLNDPASGGDIWFILNGQEKSLKPGETLDLNNDRVHVVDFNSGSETGDIRFSLYQGLYKFKVTPAGWGLVKSSSPPIASNRMMAPAPQAQNAGLGSPPLPAQDLRTRRMAASGREPAASNRVNPPLKPADTTVSGRDETGSIAAPPAPGILRQRTRPGTSP
jgi:hypothetical protein